MMKGNNNQRHQNRRQKVDKHQQRTLQGEQSLAEARTKKIFDNDYNLEWFNPEGMQQDIVECFYENTFCIVDAPSGCGKTTTALWLALQHYKSGEFKKIVFIKNPTEAGDDKIGFVTGDAESKISVHTQALSAIFKQFISASKLEADKGAGRIDITIPNFLLGATLDNSVVILDETQLMSNNTVKMLLERCGVNTKYLILGDSKQRYAVANRTDGFKDFIEKVTVLHNGKRTSKFDQVGYVKMTTDENKRSEGSKFITKLYEGEF